jgi:chromosome segregation ATPase
MQTEIIIAIVAVVGSIVAGILTWILGLRRERAAVTLNRYEALQASFETIDDYLRVLRREFDEEVKLRQQLQKDLAHERLARRKAENRIEHLSQRLDRADKLVRSLETDLEQERVARQSAETKLDGLTNRLEKLTQENESLREHLDSLSQS